MIHHRSFRILLGIVIIVLAVVVSMVAFASWQADSAAEAANWTRAISWRPDIALYHMRWAEVNLATNPPLADKELRISLKEDPYSPVAAADLATVELSLKLQAQAHALTRQMANTSSFDERWRYANMYLLQNNLDGFFEQTRRACEIADRNVFASVIARALTASQYDFQRVYAVLPHDNDWAAEAFLDAGSEYRQKIGQEAQVPAEPLGYRWLLSLKPTSDQYAQRLREVQAERYLNDVMHHSPGDAPEIWREGLKAGLFHGPPMHLSGQLIAGGSFPHPIPTMEFPEPTAFSPTRLFGWIRDDSGRILASTVYTGDKRYPTGLALTCDGDEADDLKVTHQAFLARPGSTAVLSVVARSLRSHPSGGILLIVRNRYGSNVAQLAVAAPDQWQRSSETLVLPALPATSPVTPKGVVQKPLTPAAIELYELTIEYHRPVGALPLNNVIAVTDVSLKVIAPPAGGSK